MAAGDLLWRVGGAAGLCRLDRLGQQLSHERVRPRGERDLVLGDRGAVELRRTARPRAGPPRQPAVLDLEEPIGRQPVEMERGEPAPDPDRFGCLVPADGAALFDDVQVQRTPHGILQRADRSEASVDVGWEHG